VFPTEAIPLAFSFCCFIDSFVSKKNSQRLLSQCREKTVDPLVVVDEKDTLKVGQTKTITEEKLQFILSDIQTEKKIPVLFICKECKVLVGIVNKIWNATKEVEQRVRKKELIRALQPPELNHLDDFLENAWKTICPIPFDKWRTINSGKRDSVEEI
jgi:hypothetical protein